MTWRSLGLVILKKLQFRYPSGRRKPWTLNMFRFRTTQENGHHSAKWELYELPSWALHVFYCPLSYIACYPGINRFCIFYRWTWRQYTESWVYMVYITNYCLTIIPLYLAAVEEMETELPATPSQFSLSISLFILFQGTIPLFWSAISEVKGRKASHVELVNCLLSYKIFDDSARLFSVALLVHHWDNCRGIESQHWTVSVAIIFWVPCAYNVCPESLDSGVCRELGK